MLRETIRVCELGRVSNYLPLIAVFVANAWLLVLPAQALEPKVVVTLKPIHALVTQIMDGVATPALIVDGAASPHTFTLKPSAARVIAEADVFIRVSESVEPYSRKIVEALPPSVTLVTLADSPGMLLLDQRHGGTFEKHEHHDAAVELADHQADADTHDDDEHEVKDGHIWLDTTNAKIMVDAIAKVLITKYPDHADRITSNAQAVLRKIDTLSADIESELAPVKGRPFIVFHDALQYFENRFAMPASGSVTVSPDSQPSAKRLTQVRKKIVELGAACVFAEPGFQPKLIAAVTEGTKARAGTLDPEGLALSANPDLYFQLMHGLARNLRECLSVN